jgi:hypothetical protein
VSDGRLLVLGQDAEGRSCVVEERALVGTPIPEVEGTSFISLFTTNESPPPPCPPGLGTQAPDGLRPGTCTGTSSITTRWRPPSPHARHGLHQRNAFEMVLINDRGELLLDDGAHSGARRRLHRHARQQPRPLTGTEGCRLMAFAIGTPRRPDESLTNGDES